MELKTSDDGIFMYGEKPDRREVNHRTPERPEEMGGIPERHNNIMAGKSENETNGY